MNVTLTRVLMAAIALMLITLTPVNVRMGMEVLTVKQVSGY